MLEKVGRFSFTSFSVFSKLIRIPFLDVTSANKGRGVSYISAIFVSAGFQKIVTDPFSNSYNDRL